MNILAQWISLDLSHYLVKSVLLIPHELNKCRLFLESSALPFKFQVVTCDETGMTWLTSPAGGSWPSHRHHQNIALVPMEDLLSKPLAGKRTKASKGVWPCINSCCVDRNLLHHNWRAWSTTATKKFCSCGQMELATNQPESTEHCLEVKVSFKLARDTRRVTSHWWPWSTRTAFGRRWSHREDS